MCALLQALGVYKWVLSSQEKRILVHGDGFMVESVGNQ